MKMVWLQLDDLEWLQTLLDLEDMGYEDRVLQANIKYKAHLETDTRALGLWHLQHEN